MTPIILTDANAHCNSGGDDLRQFNIPNRTKPYAHRHSTGHKKNASQTPPAKRGDILEIHTARNNYSILNDRAPGENLAPTFTASNRNTVTDYIIVPISQYHDVVAFNILPSTNLQFNTDHNVLHLISNDLPDPTPPFPDGLRPDAVCHVKYALIDLETRKQYRLAMNAAVGPWYRNGFDDLKRSLEAAQHKPPFIAQTLHDTFLHLSQTAASTVIRTILPRTQTQPPAPPKPKWWTSEMTRLTALKRHLTMALNKLTRSRRPDRKLLAETRTKLSILMRTIRATARNTQTDQDRQYFHTISTTIHKDIEDPLSSNKLAWNLVQLRRNTRKTRSKIPMNMHVKGSPPATTDREAAMIWKDSWSHISTLNPEDDSFDKEATKANMLKFETWHRNLRDSAETTPPYHVPFKIEETVHCLNDLKNFKRHGADGMSPDLLRHGGHLMAAALTQLHNYYFENSTHPASWDACPAMPLHKKDRHTDPMNYRLIAFMTAMCKVYDGALTNRLTLWAETNRMIPRTQYGYRKSTETTDMWYIFVTAVRERTKAGLKTYAASLDVKKAFPSVPRFIIWNLLFDKGLDVRLLLALVDLAEPASLWLLVPGMTEADAYRLSQGVREGSLSSPILYLLFVGDIVYFIQSAQLGIHVRGIYTGANLFADDLNLLMAAAAHLNAALDILLKRGLITRTTYNRAKTTIVIFNEPDSDRMIRTLWPNLSLDTFTMGNVTITPSNTMLLLGITVTYDLTFIEHFNILLRRTRSNTDDLDRAGATANGFDLRTSLSMWTTLFIPNYIYAMHIWYNDHMQQQLNAVLLAPVISMVAPMSSAYITPEHSDIITLELRLPLAHYQYWYSELSHESRLYLKPAFNPPENCAGFSLKTTLITETCSKQNWISSPSNGPTCSLTTGHSCSNTDS